MFKRILTLYTVIAVNLISLALHRKNLYCFVGVCGTRNPVVYGCWWQVASQGNQWSLYYLTNKLKIIKAYPERGGHMLQKK